MPHARVSLAVGQHEADAPARDETLGAPLQVGDRWLRFTATGVDDVELLLAANTGAEPRAARTRAPPAVSCPG